MRKNKKITEEDISTMLKKAKPLSWFKKGKEIIVNSKMQKNYSYILEASPGKNMEFKPFLTPKKALELGIFEGHYFNDDILEYPREWFETAFRKGKLSPERPDSSINYFGVKSRLSLKEWKKNGWIIGDDPKGFAQWFFRYYLGRRDEEIDQKQIARWNSFKRHVGALKKNCKGDISCRPKQRQACLQWFHDYKA